MSYCLNPNCYHPENSRTNEKCQSCGSKLNNLRDRYRVSKALAQGGFGATFLAQDASLPGEPSCVIKQLRLSSSTPDVLEMARELFAREAKTLGKIGNHPQLPRLLDYFEDNQQFYLVQEYISGLTLQQEVMRAGAFSEAGVRQFLSEMLPLIQHIHEQKVIHRDIKPANMIRRSQDRKLVLIDFGAVKDEVKQTLTGTSDQTNTSFAIGTPGFAPPEQLAMRPVYASDIYAIGVTCLYLLTGKSPKELEYNSLTGEMLWQDKVQVSNHLGEVLKKMLEVSVRHRYQSANDTLRALELEPYLDSLAKSMSSQRSSSAAPSNSSSGSYTSSVDQVAAAIRARRGKLPEANALHSGITGYQSPKSKNYITTTPISQGSRGQKHKIPCKLDTNSLLIAYANGKRDFSQQDLSSLDLQRAELQNTNFHSSNLNRTNFQGANLFNSDFGQASFNQANLRNANLSKAYLNNADLEGADLRGADLSYAYLNKANLRGTNLCGANLTGAKISQEQLAQAKTNMLTVRPSGKRILF